MYDIEELTQGYVDDALEYMEDFHLPIQQAINHDTLYEVCYQAAVDYLTSEAEARYDEDKLKDYDENNY